MKNQTILLLLTALCILFISSTSVPKDKTPNIVLIFMDDMGYDY
jgi:hypothetical protein